MNPRRADDALTTALDLRWIAARQVHAPEEVSLADAARVHTAAHLVSLDQASVIGAILALDPDRLSVSAWMETWRRACGGTLAAARHVVEHGGRALNLLGGFHHAGPASGGGFCGLNDVAIAVAGLRADGWTGAVVIIDLDAHPPDGIVACLGDDPAVSVLSVSVHSEWAVPSSAAARVLDRRVPARSADAAYLSAVDEVLAEVHGNALVFYLAGSDPFDGDSLGALAVSEAGLRDRDRRVFRAIGARPVVVLPAGGYHPQSWRFLANTLACAVGTRGRIPAAYDPGARRTRVVAQHVVTPQLEGDLWLTEEELLGTLGRAPHAEPRFLGFYTRHGLENALTAYGYLDTLRRMGFERLEVSIDIRPPASDRLAISTWVGGERVVLVDIAASIRTVAGHSCLFLDWLELRDPRGTFSSDRPPLPGQQKPGLGLANETMQLLARAAERLKLAGVVFVAAHYHIAWIARERFVPVDPEDRGRFRALARVLAPLPLADASHRLATTGVFTEDGVVVRWTPMELVAAVAPSLVEALEGEEARARTVEQAWVERLVPIIGPQGPRDTADPGTPEYNDRGISG